MYCENCGEKIKEDADFCSNCGTRISNLSKSNTESPEIVSGDIFYSPEWRRTKVFAVSSLPYFDVMVEDDSLYLIEMPKHSGATWGLIIGLILLNIIGAAIGAAIGGSSDSNKRDKYRGKWLDDNDRVISRAYEKNIFLKIPLEKVRSSIELGKNKFMLSYGDKKITLKKSSSELERFKSKINAYVL